MSKGVHSYLASGHVDVWEFLTDTSPKNIIIPFQYDEIF